MPPISNRVIAWHTVKTYIFLKLCTQIRRKLLTLPDLKKLHKLAPIVALIWGSFVYKFFAALIDKFFCWCMDMKELNTMDEFFLYDDNKSLSNTCIVANMEPFKYEVLSTFYKKKFSESKAFKVRLYDIFGK